MDCFYWLILYSIFCLLGRNRLENRWTFNKFDTYKLEEHHYYLCKGEHKPSQWTDIVQIHYSQEIE